MGPELCLDTVLRWAARLPQTDELRAAVQEVRAWDRRTQQWRWSGRPNWHAAVEAEEQFEASKRALAALICAAKRAARCDD